MLVGGRQNMSEIQIVESTVVEDKVDVSRWTEYGKDRLYVNRFPWSHDNSYVDLDGGEGHSLWFAASAEVDGNRVVVESPTSKGTQTEDSHRLVLEVGV